MPEDEVVNLVVPNALIGKVRWNGEPHSLPLFGDVGASYICIKEGGIVEVMLKGPGANYRKLNEAQIRKLVEQAKEKERKDKVDEGKRRERLTSMLKKWPKAS